MTKDSTSQVERPLTVVEIATSTAGQACGRLLAGLGHSVIKVERAGGDPRREVPESFGTLNAGKRSIVLDVDQVEDRAALDALIASADVVVADSEAAVRGLSVDAVRASSPHIVWASITGFGLDSTMAHLPEDSLLAESYGGLASLIGRIDQRPLALGGEQAAHAASFAGLLGISLALLRRRTTGQGDVVDVAMADLAAFMDWKSEVNFTTTGVTPMRSDGRGWWRIVAAQDGWVGIVYDPQQWDRLVALIGDERLADPRLRDQDHRAHVIDEWMPIIEAWAASRTMIQAYDEAQARGLPFGYSADMAMLGSVEQYRERGFVRPKGSIPAVSAPWQVRGREWQIGSVPALDEDGSELRAALLSAAAASASRRAQSETSHVDGGSGPDPLNGVVVLDFGTVTAGAAASRILADYGATVIKIESADRPDQFRRWASSTGGAVEVDDTQDVIPMFEANNTGKYAITLDLKDPDDQETFRALLPRVDVLIENFRVGVTERLGIDFPTLRELNPDLVYLSLASQGQHGPEAPNASYGSTLDLLSGLASVTGYLDGVPIWSSYEVNYPDQLASMVGATLVIESLERGVRGVQIDLSQRELVSWTLAEQFARASASGENVGPTGNRRGGAVPHETFQCGDGLYVAIVALTVRHRREVAGLVGLDVNAVESWDTLIDDVEQAVQGWCSGRSRADVLGALDATGVPAVAVLTADERTTTPHFDRRRVFVTSPGGVRVKGFPMVMGTYTPTLRSRAPRLGEHNGSWQQVLDDVEKLRDN